MSASHVRVLLLLSASILAGCSSGAAELEWRIRSLEAQATRCSLAPLPDQQKLSDLQAEIRACRAKYESLRGTSSMSLLSQCETCEASGHTMGYGYGPAIGPNGVEAKLRLGPQACGDCEGVGYLREGYFAPALPVGCVIGALLMFAAVWWKADQDKNAKTPKFIVSSQTGEALGIWAFLLAVGGGLGAIVESVITSSDPVRELMRLW